MLKVLTIYRDRLTAAHAIPRIGVGQAVGGVRYRATLSHLFPHNSILTSLFTLAKFHARCIISPYACPHNVARVCLGNWLPMKIR